MPSDKFNDILKNKFQNFEAPTPLGGWNAIKDRVPSKKRRGFFIPLAAAIGLFFTMLSGYLFLSQFDQNSSVAKQEINAPSNSINIKNNVVANKDGKFSQSHQNQNNNSQLADNNLNENKSDIKKDNNNVRFKVSNQTHSSIKNSSDHLAVVLPLVANLTESNEVVDDESQSSEKTDLPKRISDFIAMTNDVEIPVNPTILAVSAPLADTEKTKEEQYSAKGKMVYGIGMSSFLTSLNSTPNPNDNAIIRDISGTTYSRESLGAGLQFSAKYDRWKIKPFAKLNVMNIRQSSAYTQLDKSQPVAINSTGTNSFSFSTYERKSVENKMNLIYSGLGLGMQFNLKKSGGLYFKSSVNAYKALFANSTTDEQFRESNFSNTFAVGKALPLSKNYAVSLEGEVEYFSGAVSQNTHLQSKPYNVGVNLIIQK